MNEEQPKTPIQPEAEPEAEHTGTNLLDPTTPQSEIESGDAVSPQIEAGKAPSSSDKTPVKVTIFDPNNPQGDYLQELLASLAQSGIVIPDGTVGIEIGPEALVQAEENQTIEPKPTPPTEHEINSES
jgi:hypothetical protein